MRCGFSQLPLDPTQIIRLGARRREGKASDAHLRGPARPRRRSAAVSRRRVVPERRGGAALAVFGLLDAGLVERDAVPELARHLLVLLVEAFAVIRELADADFLAAAEPDLQEPVGVGERLARG